MPSTHAPLDPTTELPASPAVFSCSWINRDPDATCVHVVGELDIATTPQLELTLREAQSQARIVVLDLTDLAFIDATGVRAIIDATVRARGDCRRLVVVRGPAHVERLFDLTGAAEHLERVHAAPARGPLRAHLTRSRRSIRPPAGADRRRAGGAGLTHTVASTLMTRAVSAAPWLRRTLPGEVPGSTSAEA